MNRARTVYALSDPRTGAVLYVGVTTVALRERLRLHLLQARRRADARGAWINDLAGRGLRPAIAPLATVAPGDDWAAVERQWIAHHRNAGHLLNVAEGGASSTGARHSAEARRRHGEATRRAYADPVERERRRAIVAARLRSNDVREKFAEAARQRWARMTPDERAALRAAQVAGQAKAAQTSKGV